MKVTKPVPIRKTVDAIADASIEIPRLPVSKPGAQASHAGLICRAKVVKSEPAGIVVLWARCLKVGERIVYATLADTEGRDLEQAPPPELWRSAVIWRIESNCLHLTRT